MRSQLTHVFVGLAATMIFLLSGCSTTGRISVDSHPEGARILIDDEDSGLKTPAKVELSYSEKKYTISLEKDGYNPVSRDVAVVTDVDPLTPKEAVGTILCAPCCLGLPLLRFLEPVKVETKFVPGEIGATLDPAGQGLKLSVEPGGAVVLVDGQPLQPFLKNLYKLDVGEHELEVQLEGFRTFQRRVKVDERVYQQVDVRLSLAGQGVIVRKPSAPVPRDRQVQILIDGEVHETGFDETVRLEPGSYELEVRVPGFESWGTTIRIKKDAYLEIEPALTEVKPEEEQKGETEQKEQKESEEQKEADA